MNISTVLCTYIYETFVAVKTALEVAQSAADKVLDTIYGIVKLTLFSIKEILNPVIKIITSSITSMMKSLDFLWIRDFSDSKICQNLYKCDFFREYLLNPDSIFSKGVRGMFGLDGDDRYTSVQKELHDISNDFKTFKEQICSGISLDFTSSAIIGLLQDFFAQVNKWLRWLRRKVDAIYRFLRYYLDTLKRLGVFDLLNKLKAMFDCVLDGSELCTNVESANSYYRAFMDKTKLYCTRANDWIIKPDYEKMCTAYAEGKIKELTEIADKIQNGIKLFVNPSNVHPTSDCLNIAGHITGIGRAIITGKASCIPVYRYCKTNMSDIISAWKRSSGDQTKYKTVDMLLEDLTFERDGVYAGGVKLDIIGDGDELSINVDETLNTGTMNSAILIGDRVVSASYALLELKTSEDEDVVNYFNSYNLSYTDLVNLEDCARRYA